jgi:lysozyme family protein
MDLTPQLRDEYRQLFTTARVRDSHAGQVHQLVHGLVGAKARHQAVGVPLAIPWWFVGVIDELEGGSTRAALTLAGFAHKANWSMSQVLFRLERFNGFGYRRPSINVPSPYLWSFSQHYTSGGFSSDGHFDPNLVSPQCGAGVLLRAIVDAGLVAPVSTTAAAA